MVPGAAFPVSDLYQNEFWLSVSRICDVFGARSLVCACPPPVAWIAEAEDSQQ